MRKLIHHTSRCAALVVSIVFLAACTAAGGAAAPTSTMAPLPEPPHLATLSDAPAFTPAGTPGSAHAQVIMEVTGATPKVGDMVLITGQAVGIEVNQFSLIFSSGGEANGSISEDSGNHAKIEVVDLPLEAASVAMHGSTFVVNLKAVKAGTITLQLWASGKIAGDSTLGGVQSERVDVVVGE